jgi:copper chaperone CopZ
MNIFKSGVLAVFLMLAFAACQCDAEKNAEDKLSETEERTDDVEWRASGVSVEFEVLEMGCNMCRTKVAETIAGFDGVIDIDVNLEKERATFIYNPEMTAPEKIAGAIRSAGYEVNYP